MQNKVILLISILLVLSGCSYETSQSTQGGTGSSRPGQVRDVDTEGCDSAAIPFGGGSGTESDPYLICSVTHLSAMAQSSKVAYFAMTRDITLANGPHTSVGTLIVGSFDGRNHALQNFSVTLEMNQEGGFLFGQLFSTNAMIAEIKNLRLENFQILTNSQFGTATLVGTNEGRITNLHVTGNVSGRNLVGGITANNFGTISESSFDGTVRGNQQVGGISGRTHGYSVNDCKVSGRITGIQSVGGITGETDRKATFDGNEIDSAVEGSSDYGQIFGKQTG